MTESERSSLTLAYADVLRRRQIFIYLWVGLSTATRRRVSVGPELVPRQRHRLLAGGATQGSTPGTRRRQRSCAATAAREKRNNPVPLSRHKGKQHSGGAPLRLAPPAYVLYRCRRTLSGTFLATT